MTTITIGAYHLTPERVLPDVPLKWERYEPGIPERLGGRDWVCRAHRDACPQGERCIGRGGCRWGALVHVRSRGIHSSEQRITGFARLHGGQWQQVTPDLRLEQYDPELGWPLDWSRAGYLTGPVAEWLSRLVTPSDIEPQEVA